MIITISRDFLMSELMSNILVIGGAGFVGSNLVKSLNSHGCRVTCLDNYFTGNEINHVSGVEYIRGNSADIATVLEGFSFTHIFHLGEYSRVEQSFDDIDLVFEFNHKSIYEVLKFTKNQGAKLIYSGSSTKFGDDGENGSASPYAWTKKTNVELIKRYSDWFGLDYAIAYFYNVYGNGEISNGKYATLVAKFCALKKSGASSLPVVAPGAQTRNFTHVDDIVAGLTVVGERGIGDGYGIGADKAYSVIDVVRMLDSQVDWLPERRGNRLSGPVVADKTKALGWKAQHDLEDYLKTKLKEYQT